MLCTELKKWGVIKQKITLGKMFQNKQFTDHFCCLLMYVKLATVQI